MRVVLFIGSERYLVIVRLRVGNDGITDYNKVTIDATNGTVIKETDYGANSDGVTDYKDTDYGANSDGVTDYNNTNYDQNDDGSSDYED